jgi:hypothetical protein
MEERLLAKSSENISKLLTLMITHEYNVKNHIRNSRNNIGIQFVFDNLEIDLSNNLNQVLNNIISVTDSSNVTFLTFDELENKNELVCPITQETFMPEDNVALLECDHYFKKDAFMVWARRSKSCPSCRGAF